MTRKELEREFLGSEDIEVHVGNRSFLAFPKVFSTGSMGWHTQGKMKVGDTMVQFNVIITVIGSKSMPHAIGVGDPVPCEMPPLPTPEQNGTMPKNAPEGPPDSSSLFGDRIAKKGSKRSSKAS